MRVERWDSEGRDAVIVGRKLTYVAVPATIGLLSYAGWNRQYFFTILGAGLLVSIASLLVGGVVGFLFGIPKSGGNDKQATEPGKNVATGGPATSANSGLRRNTNIEEISDWLTKIIVGLGIFELKNVPQLVVRLSAFLSPAFGERAGSGAVAVTLAVAFAASGFLLGYLLTVLFITQAIVRSDPSRRAEENLAQDAKSAKLVASIAGGTTPGQVPDSLQQQVLSLARRYEQERASLPPGPERTNVMEGITREMRQCALVAYPMIEKLSASNSPGERLAAIAFIQIKPDAKWVDWLAERVATEVPFLKFQAALALRNTARSVSQEERPAVRTAVEKAKKTLEQSKSTNTDEYGKLLEAEKELA